ncbi:NgoPII family restriction endonuclease [Kingella negevensis]|uniref:NgoPII family restriction endonuclease n=1 Tax=Kingella negevensis TaxID=1522312 RepID=UPI0025430FFD|nr:NgoPII family restriction endonuclease [Kingella negevensis]WII92221.1 NgoPII family restriction endonuclease [Kingella negevensis]
MSNIINAIYNLVTDFVNDLNRENHGLNRANQMGEALEEWIKDLFANTLRTQNEQQRLARLSETFSYLGNQNNPPDMILKDGDAIEVKKVIGKDATLALNSSYPKDKLLASSPLLTQECRNCEPNWREKDIIYVVGVVPKNQPLQSLCMVYGVDYAANHLIYERIRNTIAAGTQQIPNVEFTETNELAKVKKIDPLGITDLRVRGMWSIANPFKVFNYLYQRDFERPFNLMCLINLEKYQSFNNTEDIEQLVGQVPDFSIADVMIKNPNNPAQLKPAKLITFKR